MSEGFDPYHRWLGIPPDEQPPNHYRLLGVSLLESDPDVITNAADQRMAHLRTFQSGRHGSLSQRLLNEVAAAKICLLKPEQKAAYDESLRRSLAPKPQTSEVSKTSEVWPARAGPAGHASGDLQTVPLTAPPPPLPPVAGGSQPPPLPPPGPTSADPPQAVVPNRSVAQDHLAQRRRQRQIVAALACVAAGLLLVAGLLVLARNRASEEPVAPEVARESGQIDQAPTQDAQEQGTTPEPGTAADKEEEPDQATKPDAPSHPHRTDPTPKQKPPDDVPPVVETKPEPKPKPAPKPEAPKKSPVPSDAVQAEIAARVDKLYELDKERLPSESAQLAGRLFRDAEQAKDKPDERFVLLRKAMDLAVAGGDAALVLAAADAIGAGFQVDLVAVKEAYLLKFAAQAGDSVRRKSFVESSLAVIDQAAAEGRYQTALKLATAAGEFCQMPPPNEHRQAVADWGDELEALCRQQREYETAEAALRANPDDPAANLLAGRWHCFARDDWPRGLPCLAKGGDASLAALAELEASSPADWQARAALGDRWWDLAEAAEGFAADGPRRRALHWYLAAWPDASGLTRAKIQKRLGDMTGHLSQTGTCARLAVRIYSALLEDSALAADRRRTVQAELARWQGLATPATVPDPGRWASGPKDQAPDQNVDALLGEAAGLLRAGNHQEARRKLLDAFKLNPDDIRAAFAVGLIEALEENDPAAAEKRFADCVRRRPDHVASLNNLAVARVCLKRYRQAMRDWETALATGPAPAQIAQNLGRCRYLEQEKRLALDRSTEKSLDELIARAEAGHHRFRQRTGWQYMSFPATGGQPTGWPGDASLEDRHCMVCGGLGWVDCPNRACKRGKIRVPRTRVVGRNPVTGARITETYTVSVPCATCNGRGKVDCKACSDGIDNDLR